MTRSVGAASRIWTVAVIVAACSALFVGCAQSAPSTRELTDQGEVAPVEVGWSEVSPAEDVELPTGQLLGGTPAEPTAGQPVLINFWASTCKPCRVEMPLLQELNTTGDAVVIGVTRDRFAKFANEAIDRAKVTYPNYQDANQDYAASFHGVVPLSMIPVSVVVVDGKATRIHLGPFEDMAELRAGLPG
jgi:thiol-disulfide isomerase/thioredoxin